MISRIEFFISETFHSLLRHPAMAFAAITCVTAALFVTGFVGLVIANANFAVDAAMAHVRFAVFYNPEMPRQQTWAAHKRILTLTGVNVEQTKFIAKEKAWAERLRDDPQLGDLVEYNPYPDCTDIKPVNVASISALKKEIERWPEVHYIRDDDRVSSFLVNAREAIGGVGALIGVVLFLLSLVIIHHTIELTVYARRKEIQIMLLVGATPLTVAMPFMLEGVLYGVLGSAVAIGLLLGGYRYLLVSMQHEYNIHLLNVADLMLPGVLGLLALGAVLGLLGSLGSAMKYLRSPRSKLTNA